MAPAPARDNWDESSDESTPPSSPPVAATAAARTKKFDDEEDDSDVLDSWDAEEDSETERAKAKAKADADAKAKAQAAANKKTKSQRIEEHRMEKMRRRQAEESGSDSDSSEDEATKKERMRKMEKEADMKNAEALFGDIGINDDKKAKGSERKATTIQLTPGDLGSAVDLSNVKLFNPTTLGQFNELREVVGPLIARNAKKPQYANFSIEFAKAIAKELPSEQIKKVASGLTTLSNEKMKEEKAAEKGGKKTKAQRGKVTLNAARDVAAGKDTRVYDDDGLDDGDFM